MAVRINPCHGCPLGNGCEQRDDYRRKVSGLGLRSATFHCKKLDKELRKGRRIAVSTPRLRDCGFSYYPEMRIESVAVPATIVSSGDGQFSCVIDPGHVYGRELDGESAAEGLNKYRFRRSMHARRIVRFLDEPDMRLCEQGRVIGNGYCDRPDGEDCYCGLYAPPTTDRGEQ